MKDANRVTHYRAVYKFGRTVYDGDTKWKPEWRKWCENAGKTFTESGFTITYNSGINWSDASKTTPTTTDTYDNTTTLMQRALSKWAENVWGASPSGALDTRAKSTFNHWYTAPVTNIKGPT